MSKAIRWQLRFVSDNLTNPQYYRIDIYDEGYTGSPVQLEPGDQPFVTNEDSSDDFFAPIRPQTGTLQVCTAMPNGGTLKLEDILPANNIASPLRLINITDASNPVIEWQGFLSCEAYSQNYTEIPENLSIPVISVLEAMDSVQLNQTRNEGLQVIRGSLFYILDEIRRQCDTAMSFFTHVNYSATDWRIFNKAIDNTVFFNKNEYNNENSTTYIVSGISAKEALQRLCTFMGWTAREQGTELYLERIGEQIGTVRKTLQSFSVHVDADDVDDVPSEEIAKLDWMGTDHKRDIRQGAKSVAVAAKLEKYAIDLGLPPFPYGETQEIHRPYNGQDHWIYILASLNTAPYNNVALAYYKSTMSCVYGTQTAAEVTTLQDLLSNLWDAEGIVDIYSGYGTETVRSGAFFAKVAYESQDQAAHATNDGIFVSWLPRPTGTNYSTLPIFSMKSLLPYNISSGYIKLSTSMSHLVVNFDNHFEVVWITKETEYTDAIQMHIKFGNKYWNGNQWVDSLTKIWVDIEGSNFKKNWVPSMPIEETDGYLIPVNNNSGELEVAIYPQNNMPNASHNTFLLNTFFSDLSADFVEKDDETLTDRSENHYFRLLGTNFRDEISVGTDLASSLNNQPSPSLIMTDETTPASSIDYTVSGGTEARRPEVDLLNRLAAYYGAARQRLELKTTHPTAAALPLLKMNGINDNKVYLPLSESRDWKTEECTITCFESPE